MPSLVVKEELCGWILIIKPVVQFFEFSNINTRHFGGHTGFDQSFFTYVENRAICRNWVVCIEGEVEALFLPDRSDPAPIRPGVQYLWSAGPDPVELGPAEGKTVLGRSHIAGRSEAGRVHHRARDGEGRHHVTLLKGG